MHQVRIDRDDLVEACFLFPTHSLSRYLRICATITSHFAGRCAAGQPGSSVARALRAGFSLSLDRLKSVPQLAGTAQLFLRGPLRGCEPGTKKGPQGWGWFPAVIGNAARARREQEAAAQDPSRKKHW